MACFLSDESFTDRHPVHSVCPQTRLPLISPKSHRCAIPGSTTSVNARVHAVLRSSPVCCGLLPACTESLCLGSPQGGDGLEHPNHGQGCPRQENLNS
jgi:hypothetical protein